MLSKGVDIAQETGQEVSQELVTMVGTDITSKISGLDTYTADEYKNRLTDTAVSSALSFGLMGLPGTARNVAYASRDNNFRTETTGNGDLTKNEVLQLTANVDDSADFENELSQNVIVVDDSVLSGRNVGQGENGDIRQDKRADIVIGLPASGKSSTLVDPLSEKYKARVIDSDMVKEKLPEFDNGYGAGVVHEESKLITNDWLDSAVINGDNIVYPIVGSDITNVLQRIDYLKKNGYTVNLHLNELSNEKATGRMLKRFFTDGRFLDPSLMTKYGNKPTQVYNAIKELEGYYRWIFKIHK